MTLSFEEAHCFSQPLSVFGPELSPCVCSAVLSTVVVGPEVLTAQCLPEQNWLAGQSSCGMPLCGPLPVTTRASTTSFLSLLG